MTAVEEVTGEVVEAILGEVDESATVMNSGEDTTAELEPILAELEAAGTTMVAVNDALEEIAVG